MAIDSNDVNLRLQYWWVNHKLELRRWWVLVLLVLDAFLLIAATTMLLLAASGSAALTRHIPAEAQRARQPLQLTARPHAIAVNGEWGVRNENGNTDFLARLANLNAEWFAESVTVTFAVDGNDLEETVNTFLMPGEERYVFLKDQGPLAKGASVTARVSSTTWTRPNSLFAAQNTNFSVSGIVLTPLTLITGQGKEASRVTAEVSNDSIFGFWAVGVNVVVLRGDIPLAASTTTIRNFESFDQETITVQWLSRFPAGVRVVVEPYVNAFDEENILPL